MVTFALMKRNKPYLYISISSVALIIVLAIQVNWLIQTAKIKEEIFNEKANMVLSKTTDELCNDQAMCSRIGSCMDMDGNTQINASLAMSDVDKIDSLFKKHMKHYNLSLECKFLIEHDDAQNTQHKHTYMSNTFYKNLGETTPLKGLKLKLIIPDKKQFILQEMGVMFFSSILLILVVLAMFWRTTLSLLKEKRIAEQTTDFLNNLTHEFKTPLANISLANKLMRKNEVLSNNVKLQQYSEMISSENDKLIKQVEQVLGISALERNEIPLHKEKINVHDLINEVLKSMSLQIEQKNGTVVTHYNATNAIVSADKTHLYNAINNLIDNAIKYSGTELKIEVESYTNGNSITVVIRDNGLGIDSTLQEKVFEKYYRIPTGNVHDVKGFGLGLAYVKKIIDLHEANIKLNTNLDKGTEFTITFKNA